MLPFLSVSNRLKPMALGVFASLALAVGAASAEQIVVSNYAVTTNGMPFAVAMDKGFFKEFNVRVDGILSSDGGGTTIRNLLGGNLAYGEAAVSAVVSAVQGGADLKIISGNVHTVAEFVWVAMPSSPVNSLKDLKGKKLGYTNPRSTSQALAILLMEATKLQAADVELVRTGGFGAGLTVLELGGVDVVPVAEPLWSMNPGKYKLIAAAPDVLPALSNVVGVTTGEAARTKGDFIRGVIKARRKAVEFMYANLKESSAIIAKAYNLDVSVAETTVRNLLESEKKGGLPYWGPGDLRIDTMDNMIRAQKLVGAMQGDADWSKLVDETFLPDDLKSNKPR
ncbi:MAG: ABC transporter substrate-binding protein [Proteobacteria bacterium]|nr:ABC transporter substrate-binding protein [Pseudomonadota bacterium]